MGLQAHIASLLTTAHNRAGTPAWGHRAQGKGDPGAISAHAVPACHRSFTRHLTSEEAALRERGDQANLSKDIPGNESPALRKKPDSAREGEGQQERGTLPGDGCRMI